MEAAAGGNGFSRLRLMHDFFTRMQRETRAPRLPQHDDGRVSCDAPGIRGVCRSRDVHRRVAGDERREPSVVQLFTQRMSRLGGPAFVGAKEDALVGSVRVFRRGVHEATLC